VKAAGYAGLVDKKVQNISWRRSDPIALGSFEELANQQGVKDESAEEFSGMLRE
jgi:hypothetical protein